MDEDTWRGASNLECTFYNNHHERMLKVLCVQTKSQQVAYKMLFRYYDGKSTRFDSVTITTLLDVRVGNYKSRVSSLFLRSRVYAGLVVTPAACVLPPGPYSYPVCSLENSYCGSSRLRVDMLKGRFCSFQGPHLQQVVAGK